MLLFFLLSWLFSMTFMCLNHPLSLGFILLLQTVITSLITGILAWDFWFSYILFLIMIGGMLVLFIYMTSIASNEQFKFSNKIFIFYMISLMFMIIIFSIEGWFSFMDLKNFDTLNQSEMYTNMSFHKYMNFPNLLIMIMLIIYLLLTLIMVVKITQVKSGPLRQKI